MPWKIKYAFQDVPRKCVQDVLRKRRQDVPRKHRHLFMMSIDAEPQD